MSKGLKNARLLRTHLLAPNIELWAWDPNDSQNKGFG